MSFGQLVRMELRLRNVSFHQLQTQAAVVVRALPKSGLIVIAVDGAVFVSAPKPFAPFVVDELLFGIIPAAERNVKRTTITKVLIEVDVADDTFAHHPPLSLPVGPAVVGPVFVNE